MRIISFMFHHNRYIRAISSNESRRSRRRRVKISIEALFHVDFLTPSYPSRPSKDTHEYIYIYINLISNVYTRFIEQILSRILLLTFNPSLLFEISPLGAKIRRKVAIFGPIIITRPRSSSLDFGYSTFPRVGGSVSPSSHSEFIQRRWWWLVISVVVSK